MEKPQVFSFSDYKDLLKSHAKSREVKRGYLKDLAEAAGCQRSYFSSVLHTHNHLTPDQACALAEFWGLSQAESEYFLTLVDLARAGTPLLKKRLLAKLQSMRREHEDLAKRLERPVVHSKSEDQEMFYYSSWMYSALHILSSVPEFQKTALMAERLNLSIDQTRAALAVLKKMGLVEEFARDHWRHSSPSRHVPRGSPLVLIHHGNWRQKAVLSAQSNSEESIHFTSVTAMSGRAFRQIRKLYLDLIQESSAIAGPSASEDLICLNMDLFRV